MSANLRRCSVAMHLDRFQYPFPQASYSIPQHSWLVTFLSIYYTAYSNNMPAKCTCKKKLSTTTHSNSGLNELKQVS